MRLGYVFAGLATFVAMSPIVTGQEKLKIVDHPVITVKPTCNPEGNGSIPLKIRNDGTVKVANQLSAGDLTGAAPTKNLALRPELGNPDKPELDANATTQLTATISHVFDDGDWTSTISNDVSELGKLRIVRSNLAFGISLDSTAPASPELTFHQGEPAHFRLKNADSMEYKVSWEYSVNGRLLRSDNRDAGKLPVPEQQGWFCRLFCRHKQTETFVTPAVVTIPAKGEAEIIFAPPNEWFAQVSILKEQISDCASSGIAKAFAVKTHLAYQSGTRSDVKADLIIALFLGLGATFSLILNFMLPNQMRKAKMKEQLASMGRQISNLSTALASRLRVLAGLEQRLITDRLKNLTWTNSEFTSEIQSIDQAMGRLRTRLEFLTTLGTTRTNFERMRNDLPPTIMFDLEAIFERVVQIGKIADPSDEDVKKAQALILKIQTQLDTGILGNSDFANLLQGRKEKFIVDFDETSGPIGKTGTCKRLRALMPRPFDLLFTYKGVTIKPAGDEAAVEDLIDLDMALFDLDIIRQYVELVDGMPAADELTKKRTDREKELVELLNRRSRESMYASRLLIRKMNDGFFKDDNETKINAKKIKVKVSPVEIRQFEPCEFSLRFLKDLLNGAAACEEWICKWRFVPPAGSGESELCEEGWEVMHYFQRAETYTLEITLTHTGDGSKLVIQPVDGFTGQISVLPERRRRFRRVLIDLWHRRFSEAYREWNKGKIGAVWWLEFWRLAMALFIALMGLLAGAKEQLLKLEVVPALLAIFLIGFGADQVKNLLTQKSTETSAPK